MPFRTLCSAFVATALALFATSRAPTAASPGVSIPASDTRFAYEGRFDTSKADAPVVVWQASRIRIDFNGDSLALRFADVTGQNFFDAEIDGHRSLVELRDGVANRGITFRDLGPQRHSLLLFKRSEAAAGTARFLGIDLASGAEAFAPPHAPHPIAMLFIGDSITVGACNEDGATDQWEDRRTHNNARSYGAFTADAFHADYRNIAVSGMGIAIGWVEMKAGRIWDRVYPVETSPRADLAVWTPNVVFVNLGENDDSFPTAKNLPFPADAYTKGYISLVNDIRHTWPDAHVVILRGGMFGGARSDRLRHAWEAAVAQLERENPQHVSHYVFTHWSETHPRVPDHRAMANELIAWLKQQSFARVK